MLVCRSYTYIHFKIKYQHQITRMTGEVNKFQKIISFNTSLHAHNNCKGKNYY